MNTIVWIIQGALAAMFLAAGVMKSTMPKVKIAENMAWAKDYSSGTIKFIGVSELLGAIGLILPAALNIMPIFTPIAAVALAVVMLLAIQSHAKRNEKKEIGMNVILLILFAFVAFYRF